MNRCAVNLVGIVTLALPVTAAAADFDHAVIIVLDDIGVDKVGAYAVDTGEEASSRPSTPTIDLLAQFGVRFTDAWAMPVCSPTRATIYAGAWPYRTGVGTAITESSNTRLPTSPETILALAAENDVATGLFGKWHLGELSRTLDTPGVRANFRDTPILSGFEYFSGNMDGSLESYTEWLHTTSRSVRGVWRSVAVTRTTSVTERTTSDALAWMRERSAAGERRLTVASYHLAHSTSDSATSWENPAESCGATAGTDIENYNVAVNCADTAVAALLADLPDLEDTLVILVGDNGTPVAVSEGNFADDRGKGTPYENGIRVPFIVADGGAVAAALVDPASVPSGVWRIGDNSVVTDPASVVDLYATLADFLDLGSSTCIPGSTCGIDSLSLRGPLTGGAPERTSVWAERYRDNGGYYGGAAVREGDVKLVIEAPEGGDCRTYALYDLAADRWETTDLYEDAAYAAERDALLALLATHEAEMEVPWIPVAECL